MFRILPTSLVATVTIGNAGLTAASQVPVELRIGGAVVATTLVNLGARSSQQVTLSALVSVAPSSSSVVVVVNPQGAITEADSSNNSVAVAWPVIPTIDVAVVGVSATPSGAAQGSDVQVSYQLQHRGTVSSSSVSVSISVLNAGGVDVGGLPATSVALQTTGPQTFTAVWRANTAGPLTVVVHAVAVGDTTSANDGAQTSVNVTGSPRPNLTVLAKDLTLAPDPPNQGQSAAASATVTNNGGGPSGPFAVELYRDRPVGEWPKPAEV